MAIDSVITVDYTEFEGPFDGFDENGRFWGRRVLRCAWGDRITLMQQLKGGFLSDELGTWVRPATYPWFPDARVVDVSATPYLTSIGGSSVYTKSNEYQYALVTVQYRVPVGSSNAEDPTLQYEWSVSNSSELLAVAIDDQSAPLYYYNGNRVPRDMAPMRIISTSQWSLSINLASSISALAETYGGHVNTSDISSSYLPSNYSGSWPADTLRYNGFSADETIDTSGNLRWNLTLNFSRIMLPNDNNGGTSGWQHVFPVGSDTPEKIYTDAGQSNQYLIFPRADLNALLGAYI